MKENPDSKSNRRIIYHFDTDKCESVRKEKVAVEGVKVKLTQ